MKILYILLICTFLYASDNIFLFPKQYDEGLHQLVQHLHQATSHIVIITPRLNHYKIKKSLLALLKKEIAITFFTASQQHMGVELVQFKNFELHTFDKLHEVSLDFSLIIIDNKITCKFSSPLDDNTMKRNLALLECSATLKQNAQKLLKNIAPYTTPYLKQHF